MHNLQFFTDRLPIGQLPEDLSIKMRKQGLIAPDHHRIRFCGLFSWCGGTAVFLPVNSNTKHQPELSAYYLLQTLNRYYSDKLIGIQDTNGDSLIGVSLLSLSISIYEDYITNGLYVRRNKFHSINRGKVNWSRTVSRHIPFPSETATVYLDLESSQMRYVSDCETARIHAAVIRDITIKLGVLLYGEEMVSDMKLKILPMPSGDTETQLAYLNRELSMSYSDRDITLIKSLEYYINDTQGSDDSTLIIGTRHFHNIWEAMLHKALLGEKRFNQKLPVPYYLQDGIYHEVAEKGQRTDTIISNNTNQNFAVVDAKYYTASTPKDAPGWPDLVKQFFYEKAVRSVVGEYASVTTHFVFPGKNKKLISAHVGKRGQGRIGLLDKNAGYPVIHCHYYDPVALMESYVNHKSLPELKEQILNI
ncbi:LlaJI family restriction endonuclease [Yersinia sp. 2545 StPb PI]|uniref:LlaJI family restriction endonuclease n=1 Tax=unclassified Yersinia (in: enterobacteria) TaxID=2653513 RepID=UPI003FA4C913